MTASDQEENSRVTNWRKPVIAYDEVSGAASPVTTAA
jgi:hypothetical protein